MKMERIGPEPPGRESGPILAGIEAAKKETSTFLVANRPGWPEAVKSDKFWNICERGLSSGEFCLIFWRVSRGGGEFDKKYCGRLGPVFF